MPRPEVLDEPGVSEDLRSLWEAGTGHLEPKAMPPKGRLTRWAGHAKATEATNRRE